MHRRLRGGSLSMLLVTPGVPARGESRAAREKIAAYKHLSEAQKAKLLAAMEAKEAKEAAGGGDGHTAGPQELRTEVVEELMSITDGQVVLRAARDAGAARVGGPVGLAVDALVPGCAWVVPHRIAWPAAAAAVLQRWPHEGRKLQALPPLQPARWPPRMQPRGA